MTAVRDLLRLQEIDQELDARKKRLAQIEQRLGNDTEVAAARAALESQDAVLREAIQQQLTSEGEAESNRTRAGGLERRLYGGEASPRELPSVTAELESLKERQGGMDSQVLAAMERMEGARAQRDALRARLKEAEDRQAQENAGLLQEQERLRAEVSQIEERRRGYAATLPPTSLRVYERLRGNRGATVVARIDRNACAACRVALPSTLVQKARGSRDFVYCSSCGRLLLAS